jgi:hypothetical protein
VSFLAGVCEENSYLAVFYFASCSAVLSLYAAGAFAFFEKSGFVYYQFAVFFA